MLTTEQTWSVISEHVAALPVLALPLADARGQVLAESVCADRALPAADRSAMDGFAVRAADLASAPVTLQVIGEVAAGSSAAPVVAPGTCAPVFTGANLPPGADAVAIVESTREEAPGSITFAVAETPGANILRRGENAKQGSELVPAGQRDETPEAVREVVERPPPCFDEAMRQASLAVTPLAALSRACSGIRGSTLILSLPGSERAAVENLRAILPALPHGLANLRGDPADCGLPMP